MNYIKNLELEVKAASAFEQQVSAGIVDFKKHLRAGKYTGVDEHGERKDWISVGDVWRWLERIEEQAYNAKFGQIETGRLDLRDAAKEKLKQPAEARFPLKTVEGLGGK